jgi:putative ABC transport system permease protein
MSALRRVRAFGGQFALLAALALVAALLVTAAPRISNRLADEGVREHIAGQRVELRDITFVQSPNEFGSSPPFPPLRQHLDEGQAAMLPALRDLVSERWWAAEAKPATISGPGVPPGAPKIDLSLRAMSDGQPAVTMVDGRWPSEPAGPDAPIEVVLAAPVAEELGLRTGGRLRLTMANLPFATDAEVLIVGLFQPVDAGGGTWDVLPSPLRVTPPRLDVNGDPYIAVALTTELALRQRREAEWPITSTWRYRVGPDRLDATKAKPAMDAVRRLTAPSWPQTSVIKGLDVPLAEFVRSLDTTRAVLTIVAAGMLATLAGLVLLAARLAIRRRSGEYALLRARGGGLGRIAGRSLAESLLVIPLASAAGWAIGAAVPGRESGTDWLVLLVAVITVLALPAATLASRPAGDTRRDLIRLRPSVRRLTLEISVLAIAALGTFLLRRRGLPSDGRVDPLLICVPILIAVGAAALVLRGYPWPLRLLSRLAARARGSVAFLGLARAGRSAVTGPLIVVVVAVATAAFCGVVAAGIENGRDRAAGLAVPADAMITGDRFAPETAAELAALPGVRSVAPMLAQPDQRLYPAGEGGPLDAGEVRVLVLDAAAFARVVADSGAKVDLPRALTSAAAGTGPVPALVSPGVAADLPGHGFVSAQGRRYEFTVAAVASSFPTIARTVDRFVVLPWQALPVRAGFPVIPTGFLVATGAVDEAALRQAGDDGQRRYFTTGVVTGIAPVRHSVVTSWSSARDELGRGGANRLLVFGFAAGTVGGTGLGLLAIAFAVLAGARARGRVLSRLRTMGLSRPQWRGLLLVELAPLVGVAMVTGAAVGALMPLLLTPALGLSAFTGGLPVRVRFEPALVIGVLVLGALALGVALAVEAAINRRMRLGEVLRLGEES